MLSSQNKNHGLSQNINFAKVHFNFLHVYTQLTLTPVSVSKEKKTSDTKI